MAEASDFLVEIGTEELPPKALRTLATAFRDGIETGLMDAGLAHDAVTLFATPRRLAVQVADLALRQPDRDVERRGPPVKVAFDAGGKPTRAALAFAQSCDTTLDALERIETPKGEWLVFRGTETGKLAAELLPGIVERALAALPIPRPMRWGDSDAEFVRPVHWIVMLHGAHVVPVTLFGIDAGQSTRGHRFHAPGALRLVQPADYESTLESEGRVVARFSTRRDLVERAVTAAATAAGGDAVYTEDLLDEVTSLVEWPVAVTGSFAERFLDLPEEVLVTTLQEHQRYFPVRAGNARLLPVFVTVSNIESSAPEKVRAGNERVVRPRLDDAAFFWDTDRRRSLASRVDDLGAVVFQRKLGTLLDKTHRVTKLARYVASGLESDVEMAECAATLAKCDLLTDMVGEFPALQGTMGRYYALNDGTPTEVAEAIEDQYLPRYAGDRLPRSDTGRALAIADKVDTIVGIFAVGKRPTGTSDPFGLRRAAIGVLRILIEDKLDIDLSELLWHAGAGLDFVPDVDALRDEVFDFMMDRLRAYFLDGTALHDGAAPTAPMLDAVLARRPGNPLDLSRRLYAVQAFAALDEAEALAAANKRIANILRAADEVIPDVVDEAALVEPAERALADAVDAMERDVAPRLAARAYTESLVAMAALRGPVDTFFDEVMVMADDEAVRRNRLALLGRLQALFLKTADFSRLQ